MGIIQLKNVTKRYDDKLAVDNISLDIEEGELFGLLGPNGAGKSTLISMICGLTKLDKGDIIINGSSIKTNPIAAKQNIGLVPQEIALYENISAIDNLKFWGKMYSLKGNLLKERIEEVLEATGLKDRRKEKVSKFSGGMKRRLNIACAVMHYPKIIIMDEPTVGIDPQSRNNILEFTKELNKKHGSTLIYTSHYMEEVEALCSKVCILDEGKVIAKGDQDHIKRMIMNEERVEITISEYKPEIDLILKKLTSVREVVYKDSKLTVIMQDTQRSIQQIIEVLIKKEIGIKDISIKKPTLETVFLSLTGKALRD
ncbi:ABC transporter ATP-binding protein [Clostridium intestinale]|uniref:ABC-2 type transport system ATP-binding protein n=1 Tax=Clostridium intestinale DSM 6191 TaxID=1121320 RepID=A0A1M5XQY9_9CLOT|nr:ABC transporter ATP-binding protein [Clostridium intestinale]SHI02169.1 ABC-2 type transport system ATP-binding protein [Clostridium intestinale DSM 6191]